MSLSAAVKGTSASNETAVRAFGTFTDAGLECAAGRDVLEIGMWKGRSTVAMAATARSVVSIDHFRGDGYTGPANTLPECWQNLIDHEVRNRLTMMVTPYAMGLPLINASRFGLIFYDADHTYEATRDAFRLLVPDMRLGSHLAVHDYEPGYPGVQLAVADVEHYFVRMQVVDRLAILLERKP